MRSSTSRQTSRSAGFTLIELMVTVGIAAILGTIAISTYTNQVRKSRRTDARSTLLDLASREERFMSTNSTYSITPSDLGYSATFPMTIGSGYYQVTAPTIVAATSTVPATFTITATPVAGKGQDKDASCQSFTIDSTGKQTSLNSGLADSTVTCWN
jgi:type IV pilus assembly protein PilE